MKKNNYEELFKLIFKGAYVQDLMIKLYKEEISIENTKKDIENIKGIIDEKLKGLKLNDSQKYNILMNLNDKNEDIIQLNNKINNNNNKSIINNENQNTTQKEEKYTFTQKLFANIYIILIIFLLTATILMSITLITINKPFLVQNDIDEFGIEKTRVKMIEENYSNEKLNIEMNFENKNIKLNKNEHSFIIIPKLKKIFLISYEGILGLIAKYSMPILNIINLLFGKYIDKKKLKKLKINLAIICFILPIIRLISLIRFNNILKNQYLNNFEYYTQDPWIYNKIKPQTFKIYNELNNMFYSCYLALMYASAYVIEIFLKSNKWIDFIYNKLKEKQIKQI